MKHVLLYIAGILFFWAGSASAATYYVSTTGNDSNAGTQSAPFKTIQKAADIVNPGDTVLVGDGIYIENGVGIGRGGTASAITTFKSQNKWGAKIQGTYHTGVTISANYVRVEGFDISGMYSEAGAGAFEVPSTGSNSQIIGNHMHDIARVCTDSAYGMDGIYLEGPSNVIIEGNVFNNIGRLNAGENGCNPATGYYKNHDHGIYLGSGSGITVKNNLFYNNKSGWGVHLYPNAQSNIKILNNTFVFPNPNNAGHIILAAPISNSVIANNIFFQPTVAAIESCCGYNPSNIVINNNIIYGGVIITSNVTGVSLSNNSDNTDPKLVNPSGLDFHLQSTSPAINAGITLSEVTKDYDGISRPQGGAYDIGAYEYVSGGGGTVILGDLNNDRIVNSLDWSLMSSKWLTSDTNADLNKDGAVNSLDWSIMSGNWLKTI